MTSISVEPHDCALRMTVFSSNVVVIALHELNHSMSLINCGRKIKREVVPGLRGNERECRPPFLVSIYPSIYPSIYNQERIQLYIYNIILGMVESINIYIDDLEG